MYSSEKATQSDTEKVFFFFLCRTACITRRPLPRLEKEKNSYFFVLFFETKRSTATETDRSIRAACRGDQTTEQQQQDQRPPSVRPNPPPVIASSVFSFSNLYQVNNFSR
jgi:hypothetical protein